MVSRQWLRISDIERRASNPTFFEGANQGRLIDDRSTRNIDEECVLPHEVELSFADKMGGLRRQRHVERYKVRLSQQPFQGCILDAKAGLCFEVSLAVVVHHPHIKGLRPPGYLLADPAHSDDAESTTEDFQSQ